MFNYICSNFAVCNQHASLTLNPLHSRKYTTRSRESANFLTAAWQMTARWGLWLLCTVKVFVYYYCTKLQSGYVNANVNFCLNKYSSQTSPLWRQAAAASGAGLQGLGPPTFQLAHPIKNDITHVETRLNIANDLCRWKFLPELIFAMPWKYL